MSRGNRTIPWATREDLLAELAQLENCRPIREAFTNVGASRPVNLTLEQKAELLDVIDHWANQTRGGHEALPEGIHDLRNDLHDAVRTARTGGTPNRENARIS